MLDAASEGEERFPIAGNWTKESKLSNSRFCSLTTNFCVTSRYTFLSMVCLNRRFCLSLSPLSVFLSLSLSLFQEGQPKSGQFAKTTSCLYAFNFIKEFRANISSRIVFSSVGRSYESFSLCEILEEVLSTSLVSGAYLEILWVVGSSFAGARDSEESPLCFFLSF